MGMGRYSAAGIEEEVREEEEDGGCVCVWME